MLSSSVRAASATAAPSFEPHRTPAIGSRESQPEGITIITDTYVAERTGLLIVDPYNDFMSEGAKLYNAIKPTADESGLFDNLRKIIPAFRSAGVQVFIVPHHRSRPDDFAGWQHVNMFQKEGIPTQAFAEGTWGGEFNAEFPMRSSSVGYRLKRSEQPVPRLSNWSTRT